MVYIALICEILLLVMSFFDEYESQKMPVCLIRAANGKYGLPINLYSVMFLNVSPVVIYVASYIFLLSKYRKAVRNQIEGSNLLEMKKQLHDKVIFIY